MKVLVVGQSVRNIACSAARAGHTVLAADCYCDLDLCSSVAQTVHLRDPRLCSRDILKNEILSLVEAFMPDRVVLGPGVEDMSLKGVNVLNNNPSRFSRVSDKLWLARWLERQGYPAVPTWPSDQDLPPSIVVKPRRGAGGLGCRLIGSGTGVTKEGVGEFGQQLIAQPFLEGTAASVSVMGTGEESVAVAVNEQLIGLPWAGGSSFRYCGNITPLDRELGGGAIDQMSCLAEDIVSDLSLVGSNGVDFLITGDGPVVVEVNPRFQGSLDTVEMATGINVFQAHLEAFQGRLPQKAICGMTAGRAVIYAHRNLLIERDVSRHVQGSTDIPAPGSRVTQGDPLASLLAIGQDRSAVLDELKSRAAKLRTVVMPV